TATMPPPTPNSALKRPAATPIRARRSTGPMLSRVDLVERFASEPDAAALFLDVDGVLAPIVEDPDDSSVPDETGADLRSPAGLSGLVACGPGGPSAGAREIDGVEETR